VGLESIGGSFFALPYTSLSIREFLKNIAKLWTPNFNSFQMFYPNLGYGPRLGLGIYLL
jgi:hypothetical protein